MLMQNFFCHRASSACSGPSCVLLARVRWHRQVDIGNFDFAWLDGATSITATGFGLPIPPLAFSAFQLMFAIITPALITGADRRPHEVLGVVRGSSALWSILVYTPVAHWVLSPAGWLVPTAARSTSPAAPSCTSTPGSRHSPLVLVLGTPARLAAAPDAAALAAAHAARHRHPVVRLVRVQRGFGARRQRHRRAGVHQHDRWRPRPRCSAGWSFERLRRRATPPRWARRRVRSPASWPSPRVPGSWAAWPPIYIGARRRRDLLPRVQLKFRFGYDDSLDVVGVHLVGGIVGSLLLGLFADAAVNPAVVHRGRVLGGELGADRRAAASRWRCDARLVGRGHVRDR